MKYKLKEIEISESIFKMFDVNDNFIEDMHIRFDEIIKKTTSFNKLTLTLVNSYKKENEKLAALFVCGIVFGSNKCKEGVKNGN